MPIALAYKLSFSCVGALTLGFALLPVILAGSLLWMVFAMGIIGTSWLWVKVPVVRPIVLLPDLLAAAVGHMLVVILETESDAYDAKAQLTLGWPLTWLVISTGREPEWDPFP